MKTDRQKDTEEIKIKNNKRKKKETKIDRKQIMKLKRIINKTKKGQRERKVKKLRKDLDDNDINRYCKNK